MLNLSSLSPKSDSAHEGNKRGSKSWIFTSKMFFWELKLFSFSHNSAALQFIQKKSGYIRYIYSLNIRAQFELYNRIFTGHDQSLDRIFLKAEILQLSLL